MFLEELGPSSKQTHNDESDNDDIIENVDGQQEVPVPVISHNADAVKALEDVGAFLRCKGHLQKP